MKKWNVLLTLLATISITLVSSGCGSSDDGTGTGSGGVAAAAVAGVGVTANGGYTVTFNGTSSFDDIVQIEGTNYATSQSYGAGTLSIGAPILPIGSTGTYTGTTGYQNQLQLVAQQTASNTANISGVLTISPITMATYGPISTLQYIWIDASPNGTNMGFQAGICCSSNPNTVSYGGFIPVY